jgi:uncharacterized protein
MESVFAWDLKKDAENRFKHGVSFSDASEAFADPLRILIKDIQHSTTEDRFYCIGRIAGGILTVRYTARGSVIRIIGAGYWRKGKALYEEKNRLH